MAGDVVLSKYSKRRMASQFNGAPLFQYLETQHKIQDSCNNMQKNNWNTDLPNGTNGVLYVLDYVEVCVFFCSHWSLVDVPLISFCPADHVPDWQPRIILGMVEARSVNAKKTTTTTSWSSLFSFQCTSISLLPMFDDVLFCFRCFFFGKYTA